ncbi:MAG: integration host factor subunit alpha [Deltaproteobacteria bacterium]
MTKLDIINNVYDKLGLSKRECADIVDRFFEIVKETLAKDENVKISGFGKFIVKQKHSRRGRNPQTGAEIVVAERKVLLFRLSGVVKNGINQEK